MTAQHSATAKKKALEAPLGKINYNSYMKRPSTNEQQTQRTNVSPVRQKTNAAAAWLRRRK